MPELTFTTLMLCSFPEAIVLAWLSLSLLGFRPNFFQVLKIGCLQTIFAGIFFLIIAKLITMPFGVHTIAQTFSFIVIMHYVTGISYKSSFVACVFGFTVYLSTEAIIFDGITLLTGDFFPVLNEENWLTRIPYHYLTLTINSLGIFIIRRFNVWLTEGWPSEKNMSFLWLSGFLLTQSILIVSVGYGYSLEKHLNFEGNRQLYFIFVGNTLLPVITLIIIRQFMVLVRRESENKAQLDNLRHVEELLHTMRIQRHDFTHEMQVIYGLLEIEEFQEAKEYLKRSFSEVSATSELVKTDNIGVTALLYAKTGLAEARKIHLEIAVETSLKQFPMKAREINLILGNLIDNALEAVDKLPVPERKVKVVIKQDLEGYVLEVINCGPGISPQMLERIFEPGFSTKGNGRGMGLYSISKLLKKYDGNVKVTSGTDTCFRIVIPADSTSRQKPEKISVFKRRWQQWTA